MKYFIENINWDDFHFLRPDFLWLLIIAFIILIIGLISIREKLNWKKTIAPHLRPYVIQKGSEAKMRWIQLIVFIFLSIAIIGVAGPTWNQIELPGKTLETPLVVALDLSQSMMATDIQPNRLERAKFKITDFLDANPRARTALVGFAGTAHVIVHLTNDYKIIKSHISGLSPRVMPYPGTDIQAALDVTDTLTSTTDAPATLILITDDLTDETFNLLRKFVQKGNTKVELVIMNTPTGAFIPAAYSKNPLSDNGKKVHSALNTDLLNKLNSIENIHVNPLTLDDSDMELLAKTISDHLKFTEKGERKEDDWQDEGVWLAFPIALWVLLMFRKGFVVFSIFLLFSFSSCNDDDSISFKDLWFTKVYQAQKLYDNGDFAQAADLFTDPMRKGVSYYKAGDFKNAANEFAKDSTANGAYNLGLAYFKNGDYAAAELAFGKAVELNPQFDNAKRNRQTMQQLREGESETNLEDAEEAKAELTAENLENKDMEDLGGGGQEATKEDMEKERKEETANTDIRKGKELDEVPDDFKGGKQDNSQKVLMRKVDDDPALFLTRKLRYQVKKNGVRPKKSLDKW